MIYKPTCDACGLPVTEAGQSLCAACRAAMAPKAQQAEAEVMAAVADGCARYGHAWAPGGHCSYCRQVAP